MFDRWADLHDIAMLHGFVTGKMSNTKNVIPIASMNYFQGPNWSPVQQDVSDHLWRNRD